MTNSAPSDATGAVLIDSFGAIFTAVTFTAMQERFGKPGSPLSFNPSGEEKRSLGGHSLMNRKRRVNTGHTSVTVTDYD